MRFESRAVLEDFLFESEEPDVAERLVLWLRYPVAVELALEHTHILNAYCPCCRTRGALAAHDAMCLWAAAHEVLRTTLYAVHLDGAHSEALVWNNEDQFWRNTQADLWVTTGDERIYPRVPPEYAEDFVDTLVAELYSPRT